MPCRCDEQDSPAAYRLEADKMAALLCSLCEFVERTADMQVCADKPSDITFDKWPASVRKWWKDHKRKDEERKTQEAVEERKKALKSSALNKLTKEERIALGFPSK